MATAHPLEMKFMSEEKKTWHGIPRDEVPWFPSVDAEACIGCQLCYVTCGAACTR